MYVRDITFVGDVITLGDGPSGPPPLPTDAPSRYVHIFLPGGETSFVNTGTHYVDHNGRLLISLSERWSHDRGGTFSYTSRIDECAPAQ